ncbi:MAG: decaprenyl-phosphate phosphoribosyltransferase [Candidatus Sumerlaeia bacterium]|nr:decaprenyl-phosphate phosphoribosyltransferase [Candidatus Sumerlaeia bacterium]
MNPLVVLKALRPKQWTKNLLLFAGIVFARQWGDPVALRSAFLGFLVFCLLSGVIYLVNDICDREKDAQHPKKRLRPIASGALSVAAAWAWAAFLLVAMMGLSIAVLPLKFTIAAALYVLLTVGYSFLFKHVAILDILVLAMGFVLRAVAGVEAISRPDAPVPITSYFVLTTLFLALFLAICKRRNELVTLGEHAGEHRAVLSSYNTQYLDQLVTVATAGVLFSYALWTTQGSFAQASRPNIEAYTMVATMPFVIFGIFRYLWLVYSRNEGGAPEALLLEDRPLLASVALWFAATVGVLLWTR